MGGTTGEGHLLSWKEHLDLIGHTKAWDSRSSGASPTPQPCGEDRISGMGIGPDLGSSFLSAGQIWGPALHRWHPRPCTSVGEEVPWLVQVAPN